MEYRTITDDQMKLDKAVNIIIREREVYGYQVNIDNYESMLVSMDGIWEGDTLIYKGLSQELALKKLNENNASDALISKVMDLVDFDGLKARIQTERIEQTKAKRVYDALMSQVPPDELNDLLDRAQAFLAAQAAQNNPA